MPKTIGIAADHAGKILKSRILENLQSAGWNVRDFGVSATSTESVDYPLYAAALAESLVKKELSLGIAICGSGIGMAIAANKFPGIRAGVVWDENTAKLAKAHNNLNILCLGARLVNHDRALDLVHIWIDTPFEEGRHQARLQKIADLEQKISQQYFK